MNTNPHHECSDHHGEGPTPCDLPIPQSLKNEWHALETRRQFFGRTGKALAWAGLASLMGDKLFTRSALAGEGPMPGVFHPPHFAPKAKRAISLFMAGAPSQLDTWDYKAGLAARYDEDLPEAVRGGQTLTGMTAGQARFPIAPSVFKFEQRGQCGRWVSELFPETGKIVDDIAVLNSLYTEAINHEPAILFINTGNMVPGKPCLGSWLSYGLGSANENLPAFVVMTSKLPLNQNIQALSSRLWTSGFLSPEHAGVALRSASDPVLYINDPPGISRDIRQQMLDGVAELNKRTFEKVGDPETNARIAQYEMAFRMQTSVPELADLSKEPQSTWDLYGPLAEEPGTFAYNCLMSRRLAERGVRFTQIYHRGWDTHGDAVGRLKILCKDVDRACYALVTDLKQRGLLDDTLVLWGGEFGRTVYSQGGLTKTNYGRDHHPRCFSIWMAGGGVKPGVQYGETDEYSYNVVKNPVHIRDLNATIMHLLGIDHERLSFKFQGLDQRLTGVIPSYIVRGILA